MASVTGDLGLDDLTQRWSLKHSTEYSSKTDRTGKRVLVDLILDLD